MARISSHASVKTTDATVTTIVLLTLAANEMGTFEGTINGIISDSSGCIGGRILVTARKQGASAAVIVGSPVKNINEDSSGSPTFTASVSGNNLLVTVQGEAATIYCWHVCYDYTTCSPT